jgi:hypothetical protein
MDPDGGCPLHPLQDRAPRVLRKGVLRLAVHLGGIEQQRVTLQQQRRLLWTLASQLQPLTCHESECWAPTPGCRQQHTR